jgi:hypothetical protein
VSTVDAPQRTGPGGDLHERPTGFRIQAAERPGIRALRDEVLASAGTQTGLVDVRSPEEYRGEKLAPELRWLMDRIRLARGSSRRDGLTGADEGGRR